jgi:hypothetical protein
VAFLAGLMAYAPARGSILGTLGALPGPILALAGLVAFLVVTGLLAASVHQVVAALTPGQEHSAS